MTKKYRLKPWKDVDFHHFIMEETWDKLANCEELEVEFLNGVFEKSALIHPKGSKAELGNTFVVEKDDLIEIKVEDKVSCPNPPLKAEKSATTKKKKTYSKNDIRKAAMRVVSNEELEEDDAIASAVALARLIKELN